MSMIALGADHGGYELKEAVKKHLDEIGVPYKDFGCFSTESVDYPDMAEPACRAVVAGECDKALLFCGTGVGISIAANKIHASALLLQRLFQRQVHPDAQRRQRPLPRRTGGRRRLAIELVDVFLNTAYEGGRHARRVAKIAALEEKG